MTPSEQAVLDALTAIIVEVEPSIRSFDRGFKNKNGLWQYQFEDGDAYQRNSKEFATRQEANADAIKNGHFTDSPIALEDILLAANCRGKVTLYTRPDGEFYKPSNERAMVPFNLTPCFARWVIGLPLHLQDPDVHAFLLSILS